MPTALYRFFSAENALKTIESSRLKVGRLAELNDPFDCKLHFVGANAHQISTCEEIADVLFWRRNDEHGLLCFTRIWNDPVLWSHYADHHRGVSLIFGFPKDRGDLYKVRYRAKRPPISYSDLRDPHRQDAVRKAFERSLVTKSRTWLYEQETRILLPLDQCQIIGGSYFCPFDATILKGVILGLRCNLRVADLRRLLRRVGFPSAPIWKAVKSTQGYSLRREKSA